MIAGVGLAWYSPEAWRRLEAIPEAQIQKSYSTYVRAFEDIARGFAERGIKAEKVTVDIDQMIAWCHRNGYEIDDKGRSIYGTVLLMAHDDPSVLDQPIIDDITRSVQ